MNPWLIGLPAAALAGAVTSFAAVNSRSQIFGPTVSKTASPLELALTFDDGPNPAITPLLLQLLDQYQAKATFFVIGRFVGECPELTREIAERGHLLGNHTHTHPNLFWLPPQSVGDEMRRCQDAMRSATGREPAYFRPPYGYRNPWVVSRARQLGMQTVLWTLLPGDWKAPSTDWLAARMQPIARHAEGAAKRQAGDVLCLHDGAHRALGGDRTRTLAALAYWLPRWRDQGLKFVTISEAVKLPAR
jgi:peptidoglycan/xylan/chitin deacetylase (PgdA/CDA1 family)